MHNSSPPVREFSLNLGHLLLQTVDLGAGLRYRLKETAYTRSKSGMSQRTRRCLIVVVSKCRLAFPSNPCWKYPHCKAVIEFSELAFVTPFTVLKAVDGTHCKLRLPTHWCLAGSMVHLIGQPSVQKSLAYIHWSLFVLH